MEPMLRCWRGIEARMLGSERARINAGQYRTGVAIGNRDGRDVYGRVDDVTHRNPPPALSRTSRKNERKTLVVIGSHIVMGIAHTLRSLGMEILLWQPVTGN
jgi:hypothetical protein